MIADVRKKELLYKAQHILVDLPQAIKGNQSLAQELQNRIEAIAQNPNEYMFLVDAVSLMIEQTKGKEVKIFHKGKEVSRESLVRDHGIFLAPNNSTIYGTNKTK